MTIIVTSSNVDLLKCQWLVTYMVSSPWWSLFLEDLWLSFSQRWWGFDPPRRQAGSFVAWPWRPGGRSPDPSEAAFALCAARLQKLVVNSELVANHYLWHKTDTFSPVTTNRTLSYSLLGLSTHFINFRKKFFQKFYGIKMDIFFPKDDFHIQYLDFLHISQTFRKFFKVLVSLYLMKFLIIFDYVVWYFS